jgi:Kef-type K+ transport system membrane component KefB
LAAVVGIVRAQGASAVTTLGLTVLYVGVMLFVVRPLAIRYAAREEREGRLRQRAIVVALLSLLVSALVTEAIGIHALFGAFLLGAAIPHDSLLARELIRRVQDFVVILLLPAFFAFTGMRTQIGLLGTAQDFLYTGVIILVASLGKFGGAALAARFTGIGARDSLALGVLMNTRGLMELIVLNVGLDLGVVSPRLFAMLVIMAVVTTLATAPLLDWILRGARSPDAHAPLSSTTGRAPGFE